MADLDIAGDIAALRSTFSDIKAVADVDRISADIAELSEAAGAPDLWDDPAAAQKVTSRLSHAQTALRRLTEAEARIDDLEVLVEMANEEGDEATQAEARKELASLQKLVSEMEIQTLLDGEF